MASNKGIESFGKEHVISIINKINKNYNLPFISIGSHIGTIENLTNIEWINCISNLKYYINHQLSIDDLIKNNKSIIGNCILFLNWYESNQSNYDYEAIIKLKPKAVLSIYEVFNNSNGSAGSKEFYEWTKDSSNEYHLREMYKLIPSNNSYSDYVMDIRIGLWQHDSIFNDDDAIIIYLESKIEHEKSCYIM
jgi:hypothetical protein